MAGDGNETSGQIYSEDWPYNTSERTEWGERRDSPVTELWSD